MAKAEDAEDAVSGTSHLYILLYHKNNLKKLRICFFFYILLYYFIFDKMILNICILEVTISVNWPFSDI